MKKSILMLAAVAFTTAAFAQGKIIFQNDAARLIRWTTNTALLLPPQQPFAGQPIDQSSGTSGFVLIAGLYAGTTSSSLSLLTTAQFGMTPGSPGLITPTQVLLPFPGTPAWLEVKIWDRAYASYEAALAAGYGYLGNSPVFSVTPGPITPVPIDTGGGSTWPAEPIYVALVPEPTTATLLGLAGVLLLQRFNRNHRRHHE